jgi:zinc/manganese transport system substrate-binding protein
MKKILLFFLLILIFPKMLLAEVKIVATLPVFGSLANAVGGERVSVQSLGRPNQDPHFLQAKPSYSVALNRADLLIHAGMDLEVGWLPVVLLQSRNPKIQTNALGNVDASVGIQVMEIPTGVITRAMGDVHPLGNPHYYLDPRNGAVMARNIFQHLVGVDPEGEVYYRERLSTFEKRLNQKLVQWKTAAGPLAGKNVVTYHKTYNYFAAWTGLNVAASVEPKPGIPPSSKHVDWLLEFIPQNQIKAILMEPYYPKKVPEVISAKTGVPLAFLPANTNDDSEQAFFQLFDELIQKVVAVIK